MKRLLLLTILAQILGILTFGQGGDTDSTTSAMLKQLTEKGYYSQWYGQPDMHQDNMEIMGYTDLDKRILFIPDYSFEEIIFEDWQNIFLFDSCDVIASKEHVTILLSGKWELRGDTIHMQYTDKRVYPESQFSECFYYSMYKSFRCEVPPRCTCKSFMERDFVFKNEGLCEVVENGECYR